MGHQVQFEHLLCCIVSNSFNLCNLCHGRNTELLFCTHDFSGRPSLGGGAGGGPGGGSRQGSPSDEAIIDNLNKDTSPSPSTITTTASSAGGPHHQHHQQPPHLPPQMHLEMQPQVRGFSKQHFGVTGSWGNLTWPNRGINLILHSFPPFLQVLIPPFHGGGPQLIPGPPPPHPPDGPGPGPFPLQTPPPPPTIGGGPNEPPFSEVGIHFCEENESALSLRTFVQALSRISQTGFTRTFSPKAKKETNPSPVGFLQLILRSWRIFLQRGGLFRDKFSFPYRAQKRQSSPISQPRRDLRV